MFLCLCGLSLDTVVSSYGPKYIRLTGGSKLSIGVSECPRIPLKPETDVVTTLCLPMLSQPL